MGIGEKPAEIKRRWSALDFYHFVNMTNDIHCRLLVYFIHFPSGLRAGAELRKAVGCCSLGERGEALLFWQSGGTL